MSPRPDWKALLTDQRARKRRLAELAADPRPRAFQARWGVAVVHLDTTLEGAQGTRPSRWRCTWLDHEREPIGHATVGLYEAALYRAHEEGADLRKEVAA